MSRHPKQITRLSGLNEPNASPANANAPQLEEELSMFSNTRFYDMDVGRSTDIATTVDELLMQQEKQIQYPQKSFGRQPGPSSGPPPSAAPPRQQASELEFNDLQEFSLATELPAFNYYFEQRQAESANQGHAFNANIPQAPSASEGYARTDFTKAEDASRAESLPPYEEDISTRHIARQITEEDKRRRNTAASARFRIKKKLKEQEMERNSKQMQTRIDELEKEVKKLEIENKWLKNLMVERNQARGTSNIEDLRNRILSE